MLIPNVIRSTGVIKKCSMAPIGAGGSGTKRTYSRAPAAARPAISLLRFPILTTNLNEEKAANTKLNTVALRKSVNAKASTAA
jgi:hypothetical protein